MAFLRFTRDTRGYEHFYLVEQTSNRRGKSRSRVLYFFRTPPNVKVGREPFDDSVRRALEARYPDVEFDWRRILETPIPSADAEKWRERRRQEKAEKAARRASREDVAVEAPVSDTGEAADLVSDTQSAGPDLPSAEADVEELALDAGAGVPGTGELVSDTADAEDDERPPHAIEAAIERTGGGEVANVMPPRKRRRRRRRGRRARPAGTEVGTQTGTDPGTDPGTQTGTDPAADHDLDDSADEPQGD